MALIFKVEVEDINIEQTNWLKQNVGNAGDLWDMDIDTNQQYLVFYYCFKYEDDAVAFKLRWI